MLIDSSSMIRKTACWMSSLVSGHLRVGLVADDAVLEIAFDRLEQFVAELRRRETVAGAG